MKHVIAFDVSMGKSTMVIYNQDRYCEWEGDIEHTTSGFAELKHRIQSLVIQDGQAPALVFEATGVYSKALE